jgi:hypothetical protein
MIDNPQAVTDIIAVSENDDADCTLFMYGPPQVLGPGMLNIMVAPPQDIFSIERIARLIDPGCGITCL